MGKIAKILIVCVLVAFALEATIYAKQLNWTYPACVPASHPYGQIFTKHFQNISQRTNSQLNIKFVSWGETAYKGSQALRVMKNNLEACGAVLHVYVVGDNPLLATTDMMFLRPKHDTDINEFYRNKAQTYADPKVKAMRAKIAKQYNYVSLGIYFWGPQNFFMRVPLNTQADFKGKQIRYPTAEGAILLKALGATAVVVTAPEVYTSLQRGLFDGVVSAPQTITALKWGEVLSHTYLVNQGTGGSTFAVNQSDWDSLTADVQKILSEEVAAAINEINVWVAADTPKSYEKLQKEYGFTQTVASEADYQIMRNICKEKIWPAWIKRVGSEGREVLNAVLKASGASERF